MLVVDIGLNNKVPPDLLDGFNAYPFHVQLIIIGVNNKIGFIFD